MYKVYRMSLGRKIYVQSGTTNVFDEKRARKVMSRMSNHWWNVYLLERVEE